MNNSVPLIRKRRLSFEPLEQRRVLSTGPIISEFGAQNDTTIADGDGFFNDWIEIYNPTATDVNLTGWYLTDSADDLTQWQFPAVTLAPGEFFVLFASDQPTADYVDAGGYLHTNFSLNGDGEYLALVEPDMTTVAWAYDPEYPIQYDDISYGVRQEAVTLVDLGADAYYYVPTSANATDLPGPGDAGWTDPAYDDSQFTGPVPLGVGFEEATGLFDVNFIQSNVAIDSITTAEQIIADPGLQNSLTNTSIDVINYWNSGIAANFANDNMLPGVTDGTDVDRYIIEATATVYFTEAGPWTLGVNSDDGFSLDVTGHGESFHIEYPSTRGASDTLGVFDVTEAGRYQLRMVMFENGGGSSVEMFAAQGSYATFQSDAFYLIGDSDPGALHLSAFGEILQTDIGSEMRDVNSSTWLRVPFEVTDPTAVEMLWLDVNYNDGFVAYIDGVEVARVEAPETLEWDSAATSEIGTGTGLGQISISLPDALSHLVAGENVLAIHGLNASVGDEDFLIDTKLTALLGTDNTNSYMATPTPGGPNLTPITDIVSPVEASVTHGYYDTPFYTRLETPTEGATIYYTTDGTEPSPTNGTQYVDPIYITGTTTLRAAAYKTGYLETAVETTTYFFISDIITQSANGSAPDASWPAPGTSVNGQKMIYGMDPDIVNSADWSSRMTSSLESIPTLSIVTDLANLFDSSIGIYVNAMNDGYEWERECSVELIYPDGATGAGFPDDVDDDGFQVNAGLRIRGGYSRTDSNPKHSFRLFFRNEYGAGKLDYELFGDEGVDRFDCVDLRTSQNYSWAFGGPNNNTMIREVWSRDLQGELGSPYTRSRYYHLYLNGQYWGIYMTEERAEADFYASNYGGNPEDYDVMHVDRNASYAVLPTDGNDQAYRRLWEATTAGFVDPADYYRVQGMNVDGTRNPEYERLLDVDNLIDYMLITYFTGDRDGPASRFGAITNNFMAIYNRENPDGFKFFEHDSEHSLGTGEENMVSPLYSDRESRAPLFTYFNPHWLHEQLCATSAEYRTAFADKLYERFYNGGIMSYDANLERLVYRANQVSEAIIAESARWGDTKVTVPKTWNDWLTDVEEVYNWIVGREDTVVGQVRAVGWYPSINPAMMAQHGGRVAIGYEPIMTSAAADSNIYYTLDGSDPRLVGGGLNPDAEIYSALSTQETLFAAGAVWKYLDDGSDQGTAWRESSFDDSSWAAGPGELGYGDGGEATTLSYGPDASNKYRTNYFRKTINITDAENIDSLTLGLRRDDGAIVYLNGVEIIRNNMPAGDVNYLTFASSTVGSTGETTYFEYTVDPALLVEGNNVIAVEMHQGNATSSDISFDMWLEAMRVTPAESLVLTESTILTTRVLSSTGEWSAMAQAAFYVGDAPTAGNLMISEINYNGHGATADEIAAGAAIDSDFEFIELWNPSAGTVDLTGVTITDGLDFTFTFDDPVQLAPGEYGIITTDATAFAARYPGAVGQIIGEATGALNNGGEDITVLDAEGSVIFDFDYDDSGDWPGRADGAGGTLVFDAPLGADPDDADNWRGSTMVGGTPGGPAVIQRDVLVNEVLARPAGTDHDAIELYNTTTDPIDIGGWYLSDSLGDLTKFQIPDDTILGAGDWIVFYEGIDLPFGISASGDDVWLTEAAADGSLLRFADHVELDASPVGQPYGRYPDGTDPFRLLTFETLGGQNERPVTADIVINELHITPDIKTEPVEFIELLNTGESSVDLFGWTFSDGIDYTFTNHIIVSPGDYVVIAQDPTKAALKFGISIPLGPYEGKLSGEGERVELRDAEGNLQDRIDYGFGFPWPTVGDAPGDSFSLIDPELDNDLGGSWRSMTPTPGAENAEYSTVAPPQLRQVDHSIETPHTDQAITITVKATDPDGIGGVTLQYQIVEPGDYISIDDPRYETSWISLAMYDDGIGGGDTFAADDIYSAVIPADVQAHRRLIRYRIIASDTQGASVTAPYDDDPQPNFAYFCYDGIPDWTGSAQPGTEPDVTYTSEMLSSVPVYQLITTATAHEDSQHIPDSDKSGYTGDEYLWTGALVYDGEVYDHIHFRARGGVWRYAMGKNMWKFDFNRGHELEIRDDYGEKYDVPWDKLNFSAIIQQGNFLQRGEQGLFESVGFALHNMAGNEAPNTNYAHFRIITGENEDGADQYSGDFQGLYLAIEQLDGNFLDQHDLPDGNLYKMEGGTGTLNNQGATQPDDRSDLNAFMAAYTSYPNKEWWESNLDLENYYNFRAIAMAIHDYDIHARKNYFYYHNPETDLWQVVNWDLDLTWTTTYMGGGGTGPLNYYVFSIPEFVIDYNSRLRELEDLLFNEEQVGMLLDESASFVHTPGIDSFVDADRAMWDYNPIMASAYVSSYKAGQGRYYEDSPTDNYAGMITKLKEYAAAGINDPRVTSDDALAPETPTLSYVGAVGYPVDDLRFVSSNPAVQEGTAAAIQYRVAEVTNPAAPCYDPTDKPRYEIDAVWQSDPLTSLDTSLTLPGGPIEAGHAYRVRVRVQDSNGRWSHWSDPVELIATEPVGSVVSGLRISEVQYNPMGPVTAAENGYDNDDFEFIELFNASTETIDLSGVSISEGVDFTFAQGTTLGSGEYIVIVEDLEAFTARYGPDISAINVAGKWSGGLDNGGEELELSDAFGREILEFQYGDSGDWPGRADGVGSSLVLTDLDTDPDDGDNWSSSVKIHGTPGTAALLQVDTVVINELLTHTDPPLYDTVEFYNTTGEDIDIGGWWISDDSETLMKYQIPANTILAAGAYITFDENDFAASGVTMRFDAVMGEDVWLVSVDDNTQLDEFVDRVEVGPALWGESFGLWPNATGDMYPMIDRSLGSENPGPRPPRVAISQIMYHSALPDGVDPETFVERNFEFVEIYNATCETIPLDWYDYDGDGNQDAAETTPWRLTGGIDFTFPTKLEIASYDTILIVGFDPNDTVRLGEFTLRYGFSTLTPGVDIVGPYTGSLNNGGEKIRLERPDEPPADQPAYTPYMIEDEVDYDDNSPWPAGADGLEDGLNGALRRISPVAWGNEATNWTATTASYGSFPDHFLAVSDNYIVYQFDTLEREAARGVLSNDADSFCTEGVGFCDAITAIRPAGDDSIVDPAHGTLIEFGTDGSFHYQPDSGYLGTDTFTYRMTDGYFTSQPVTVSIDIQPERLGILGRYVFYNGSSLDGGEVAIDARDDDAIATDKTALLPGETATFANYTSSIDGITGIMIDVQWGDSAPGTISVDDFSFRIGNSDDSGTWSAGPAPTGFLIREGEGIDGGDRIVLTLDEGTAAGQWLQVTFAATVENHLLSDDIFYYGNAPCETGDSTTDAYVTAADAADLRSCPTVYNWRNPADATVVYDFNRDGRVNAYDSVIVRHHYTDANNSLRLITPTIPEPAIIPLVIPDTETPTGDQSTEILALSPVAPTLVEPAVVEPAFETLIPEVSIDLVYLAGKSVDTITTTNITPIVEPLSIIAIQSPEPAESAAVTDETFDQFQLLEEDASSQEDCETSDLNEKLLDDLFATWDTE